MQLIIFSVFADGGIRMSVSSELIFSIVIQLIAVGIFIGVYKATVAFMQLQIKELKEDMRKYNNMLERLIKVEQKADAAHQRIDDILGEQ